MNPDTTLFHLINNRLSMPLLDLAMPVISNLKYFIPFLAILVAWMAVRDGRRGRITIACLLVLVPATDQISSHLIKPAVSRPRPCRPEAGLENVILRAHCSSRGSFPSSHAANIGGVALLMALRYRRRKVALVAGTCAFLVGYSRIYLGVHYPTDVVGGWVLGAVLGGVLAAAARTFERHRYGIPEPAQIED